MRVVVSHGDFMNRRLGIPNLVILDLPEFRQEVGVELEAYDAAFMRRTSSSIWDTLHPVYWIPRDPLDAIQEHEPVIYLLVHPRHWHVNRVVNALDDLMRLEEELLVWLPLGARKEGAGR
jgi:hypothetical protein